MDKYIDLIRVIIKNFNIDNNHEFDHIIKEILNKIFDEYYNLRNKIFDNNNNKIHIALMVFIKNTIFEIMN